MRVSKRIVLAAVVLLIAAASATAQNNAEQIVFSGTGATMNLSNTSGNQPTSTPFGFWVWCAGSAAPGSKGGYQNDNACQGSMYFYGLFRNAAHVIGFVSEGPDGIYTMNLVEGTAAQLFSDTLNPSFTCTLTNTVPDAQGSVNSNVNAKCMFLKSPYAGVIGTSTVTNVVVQVTGQNRVSTSLRSSVEYAVKSRRAARAFADGASYAQPPTVRAGVSHARSDAAVICVKRERAAS